MPSLDFQPSEGTFIFSICNKIREDINRMSEAHTAWGPIKEVRNPPQKAPNKNDNTIAK